MIVEQKLFQGLKDKGNSLVEVRNFRLDENEIIDGTLNKDVTKEFIGVDVDTYIPTEEQIIYAARDTDSLHLIKQKQLLDLDKSGMKKFILDVELAATRALAISELHGIEIDTNLWMQEYKENKAKAKEIIKELNSIIRDIKGDADIYTINSSAYKAYQATKKRIATLNKRGRGYLEEKRNLEKQDKTGLKKYTNVIEALKKVKEDLKSNRERLVKEKKQCRVNWGSTSQVIELFKKIGFTDLPRAKDKKTKQYKPSLGKGARKEWFTEKGKDHEFYKLLKKFDDFKNVIHLVKAFGDKWLEKYLHPTQTNKIFTIYRQANSHTGRLQSGNTKERLANVQQLPTKESFRNSFLAGKGRKMVTCDYSSAELVIMVSLAKDKTFNEIRLKNPDLHSFFAQLCWKNIYKHRAGKEKNEAKKLEYLKLSEELIVKKDKEDDFGNIIEKGVNSHLRKTFKLVTFGIIYGAFVTKVAQILGITKEEAQIVIDTIRNTIPDTFRMVEKATIDAFTKGYVVCHSEVGTRRYFDIPLRYLHDRNILSDIEEKRRIEEQEEDVLALSAALIENDIRDNRFMDAVDITGKSRNCRIQGLQAEMIKNFFVKSLDYCERYDLDFKMLMTIHDECVFSFPDWYVNADGSSKLVLKLVKLMEDCANEYLEDYVEMKVGYKIAPTWVK